MPTPPRPFLFAALTLCAAAGPASRPATVPTTAPADLALDDLRPPATLPAAAPRAGRPPLEAVALFGEARGRSLDGRSYAALALLQKAAALDADSADVQLALGNLYRQTADPRAAAAYRKAAALDPDRAELQLALATVAEENRDPAATLLHLRLARQTRDYDVDAGLAAEVDFRLAEALRAAGYDRAALESYRRAAGRIEAATLPVRARPLARDLLANPAKLYAPVADLQAGRGEPQAALATARHWSHVAPDDEAAQSRVIDLLLAQDRPAEAVRFAAAEVSRSGASGASLLLLRRASKNAGADRLEAVITALADLLAERPNDRALTLALAAEYRAAGRNEEGIAVLAKAAVENRGDATLLRVLMRAQANAGRPGDAAAAWARAVADDPSRLDPFQLLLSDLLGPSVDHRLTAADFREADVPAAARPALLYAGSVVADAQGRYRTAEAMLDEAVAAEPLFRPAYVAKLERLMARKDADPAALVADARRRDPALAAELEGLVLLTRQEYGAAVAKLREAASTSASPSVLTAEAAALQQSGDAAGMVKVLGELVTKYPAEDAAWNALLVHHFEQREFNRAATVLRQWLAAEPRNVNAQLARIAVAARANEPAVAERLLLQLWGDEPTDPRVIDAVQQFFLNANRPADLIARLGETLDRDPGNLALLAPMAGALHAAGRGDELDARLASAGACGRRRIGSTRSRTSPKPPGGRTSRAS